MGNVQFYLSTKVRPFGAAPTLSGPLFAFVHPARAKTPMIP
jgi:hypothetical protein